MVYALVYRCFKICSDWTKFHEELSFLKQVFLKNGYPLSFIDNCFKKTKDLKIPEEGGKLLHPIKHFNSPQQNNSKSEQKTHYNGYDSTP